MTALSNPWPVDAGFNAGHSTFSDEKTSASPTASISRRRSLRRTPSFLSLLQHYDESKPGTRPPGARTDPTIAQRQGAPFSLWNLWKIGYAAALKASEVATDVLQHTVYGPRRKTWPLEMTIVSSFMRNAGRHSHLVDIATMRVLINLGGLVPLPADALVTPVTFRVRRRHLRGILAEFDRAETNTRELQGEWIVGKRLWRRLQAEWRATHGHHSLRTVPGDGFVKKPPVPQSEKGKGRVVLFLHGGAYYCFSAATHRLITIPLSKYADARVFAVDYRLAPETRFPGPLHDAVSAYIRLVDDLHVPPSNILVAGDSAGGGLALALLMYLRDTGRPLPAGAILMSPWVDLTMSCESWDTNAPFDVVPIPQPGDALDPVHCYLGEHMERYLTHPYASPLFGSLRGLPPLLVQAGEAEVLRDEITLLVHKAKAAGVDVRHEIYEDAVHVFQAFPFLDTATRAFESVREWVQTLPPVDAEPEALGTEMQNEKTVLVDGAGAISAESKREQEKEERGEEDDVRSWRAENSPWPSPPPSDDESITPPASNISIPSSTKGASTDAGDTLSESTPKRGRNHHRRRTVTVSAGSPGPAPRPSIRSSASHVDISALCADWAAQPTEATTFRHESSTTTPIKGGNRRGASFIL